MSTTPEVPNDERQAGTASSPRDPRALLVLLVLVAAAFAGARARAQEPPPRLDADGLPYLAPREQLSDASVSDPQVGYVGSALRTRRPTDPAHREVVGGITTLVVGVGVALVGAAFVVSGTNCHPVGWFDCLFSDVGVTIGEVALGLGGLAILIGIILIADGSPRALTSSIALTGGPGDIGAGLRFVL